MKARIRTLAAPLALALLALFPVPSYPMPSGDHLVREVIDGDTVVLSNGQVVRYVGVDTPEINEPFYFEAKVRNSTLVLGKFVRVVVCGPEPRDRYGRVLAWVYSGGRPAGDVLLEEGLARSLVIPPCGLQRAREQRALEASARAANKGIWGPAATIGVTDIIPAEADRYLGQTVRLTGRVSSIRPAGQSVFMLFDAPNGFKAVIMPQALEELTRTGVSLLSLVGTDVTITGIVTERDGAPEMLIDNASRLR